MKNLFLSLSSLLFFTVASAQLKTEVKCPDINVNILSGTVNGVITPTSNAAQVKKNLVCFSSFEEDPKTKCGASVFYKDKDIYFYTTRNYVEIGPNFKGTLSIPLMGAARDGLFKTLGDPEIKQPEWDAFKTAYGILILYYDKQSKVDKIQFSTKSTATIQLCE
ncbi:MAG: hypothetical protein ABI267_07735 [Ginsengibacter sp.]